MTGQAEQTVWLNRKQSKSNNYFPSFPVTFNLPFMTNSLSFTVTGSPNTIPTNPVLNSRISATMASSNSTEITHEFPLCFKVFKDGRFERLTFPYPLPPLHPKPGVESKDVVISSETGVSARVFFPKIDGPDRKLPLLIHYHGGGFCIGSPFDSVTHNYELPQLHRCRRLRRLQARAGAPSPRRMRRPLGRDTVDLLPRERVRTRTPI